MRFYKNIFLAKDINGFLTNREGQLLYSLAAQCTGRGVVVEIGSWKGKSTIWLAKALQDKNIKTILYAIDPHTGSSEHQNNNAKIWTFDEFTKNITQAGVSTLIRPIVKFSAEALNDVQGPIELLFIDGGHEYEFVSQDYKLYAPLVCESGFIAFHDTPWLGVKQFVREALIQDAFRNVYFTDTLLVAQKVNHASTIDKIKTSIMLTLNECFQFACTSKSPKIVRTFIKNIVKCARDVTFRV